MSTNSPGDGPGRSPPWSASLPPDQMPLEAFFRSGVSSIPVALVPLHGGTIRLNNPKAVQAQLQAATHHYLHITDVRQFGRGGIVCQSPDQACVYDLLKCSSFGSLQVSAFIPPHLACTKGIVRGVDSNLSPAETLEKLSAAGAISVYRCNRLVDNARVPTESVIATFAGTSCPTEIKIWPLIFRVDPLASRPLQCRNCWRFGHSIGGCKSSLRCCTCGESHSASDCSAQSDTCCLCDGAHKADYSNCPARNQEIQILEVMDKRRCSRRDAIVAVKERAHGYASVTARHQAVVDGTLSEVIAQAIEKSMAKIMERIVESVTECFNGLVSSQLVQLLPTATAQPMHSEMNATTPHAQEDEVIATSLIKQVRPIPGSSSKDTTSSVNSDSQDTSNMEIDVRAQKRRFSPLENTTLRSISKSKKILSEVNSKSNILEEAVASAVLSSPEGR